jgi:hypothetical protein
MRGPCCLYANLLDHEIRCLYATPNMTKAQLADSFWPVAVNTLEERVSSKLRPLIYLLALSSGRIYKNTPLVTLIRRVFS